MGELISDIVVQEKRTSAPKGILTTTFKYSLSKQDDCWNYRHDFKIVDSDRATQQQKKFFEQHTYRVFLLNKYGVISKSSDRSEMTMGVVQNTGIANAVFTLDSNERLVDITCISNICYDNAKTTYKYDDKVRLKIKRSVTEFSDYIYEESGREKKLLSTKFYSRI